MLHAITYYILYALCSILYSMFHTTPYFILRALYYMLGVVRSFAKAAHDDEVICSTLVLGLSKKSASGVHSALKHWVR